VETGMREIDWDAINSEDDLVQVATEFFDEFGFSSGVFAYTPIGTAPSGRPGLLKRALAINFDESVIKQWFQFQDELSGPTTSALSQSFDPVRRRMSQRVLPERIVLQELLEDKSAVSNVVTANWIRTMLKRGLRESFHTPVFTGRGEYWSLAAFRFEDNPNTGPLPDSVLCQLHWLTVHFVAVCIDRLEWRVGKTEYIKQPLTPRELDCLYWAALGYSTRETAEILKIHNETVRQYIKQALKKLNARNKTQAIWLAHRYGYLALP
jgi:DNA-binding CsgD family transcriptional regulator